MSVLLLTDGWMQMKWKDCHRSVQELFDAHGRAQGAHMAHGHGERGVLYCICSHELQMKLSQTHDGVSVELSSHTLWAHRNLLLKCLPNVQDGHGRWASENVDGAWCTRREGHGMSLWEMRARIWALALLLISQVSMHYILPSGCSYHPHSHHNTSVASVWEESRSSGSRAVVGLKVQLLFSFQLWVGCLDLGLSVGLVLKC